MVVEQAVDGEREETGKDCLKFVRDLRMTKGIRSQHTSILLRGRSSGVRPWRYLRIPWIMKDILA